MNRSLTMNEKFLSSLSYKITPYIRVSVNWEWWHCSFHPAEASYWGLQWLCNNFVTEKQQKWLCHSLSLKHYGISHFVSMFLLSVSLLTSCVSLSTNIQSHTQVLGISCAAVTSEENAFHRWRLTRKSTSGIGPSIKSDFIRLPRLFS